MTDHDAEPASAAARRGSQTMHTARLPCRWPAKDVIKGDRVWSGLNQSDHPARVVQLVVPGTSVTRLIYADGTHSDHPLDSDQQESKVWLG